MKPSFILITLAAGFLLAATPGGWAIPPRQHSASGVIVGVNREAHTLTVAASRMRSAGLNRARWNTVRTGFAD